MLPLPHTGSSGMPCAGAKERTCNADFPSLAAPYTVTPPADSRLLGSASDCMSGTGAPTAAASAISATSQRGPTLMIKGKPSIINVGPRWLVAEMADAAAVGAPVPDMQSLADPSNRLSAGGVTVYGAASDGKSALHVRSFAPAHGIPEDPVCGSGNISVAAYLKKSGQGDRFGKRYVARQGMQLGRDGQVSIHFDDGKILLGGSAVTCVEGTLLLP